MMTYKITKTHGEIRGSINLSSSKSISNRLLIINALCNKNFTIENLAVARDTKTLASLLNTIKTSNPKETLTLDALDAGTTFRFLTAFLSIQSDRTFILTGSERMKERPIKKLVDALTILGAKIEYAENEGYPPLKITGTKLIGSEIEIEGNISSQYITALLLIAPTLKNGLTITLLGNVLSQSYIEMTLNLMQEFGIKYIWDDNKITIAPQEYIAKDFFVEADWSSASYWYSIAALATDIDIELQNLKLNSIQGDSVIRQISTVFGVETEETKNGLRLFKKHSTTPGYFSYDFSNCPDIAQTVAVICGELKIGSTFLGIENLKIKETDRIQALKNELLKIGIVLDLIHPSVFTLQGHYQSFSKSITINTYDDHRMAMAFAPLAIKLDEVIIENPSVVQKSYPDFWVDLISVGFKIEEILTKTTL